MNVEGKLKSHNPKCAKINCVRLFELCYKDRLGKVHIKKFPLMWAAACGHRCTSNITKNSKGALRAGCFAGSPLPCARTHLV